MVKDKLSPLATKCICTAKVGDQRASVLMRAWSKRRGVLGVLCRMPLKRWTNAVRPDGTYGAFVHPRAAEPQCEHRIPCLRPATGARYAL